MKEKQLSGFMTYRETAFAYTLISDEDAAAAIKATCRYFLYGEVSELSGPASEIFDMAKSGIDRGIANYAKAVESGRKGGNARWGKSNE